MSASLNGNTDFRLLYFYKEVILHYELNVSSSPLGFHISNKAVSDCIQSMGMLFYCAPSSETLPYPSDYKTKPRSFFLQLIAKDNTIGKELSTLASCLYHLRNSFAHGRFEIVQIEDQEYLCLYDIKSKGRKRGLLSMIAQAPIDKFILLIEIIKRSQKNEK